MFNYLERLGRGRGHGGVLCCAVSVGVVVR